MKILLSHCELIGKYTDRTNLISSQTRFGGEMWFAVHSRSTYKCLLSISSWHTWSNIISNACQSTFARHRLAIATSLQSSANVQSSDSVIDKEIKRWLSGSDLPKWRVENVSIPWHTQRKKKKEKKKGWQMKIYSAKRTESSKDGKDLCSRNKLKPPLELEIAHSHRGNGTNWQTWCDAFR